ncbi:hypothetical protein [Actinoplanes sp. NPDC023714]|uniref:hypothetical protein n=1 Tax=Actinoplanes sp. NPDC023714 TaxID=3154322 RepID=UPI0033C3C1C9
MSLPPVSAEVTADAVAALPGRLRARLDAVIEQARGWSVEAGGTTVVVRPDDQITVTLTDPVTAAGDAVCSCLLAPKCLHRTAVLSIAPILNAVPTAERAGDPGTKAQRAGDPDATEEGRSSGISTAGSARQGVSGERRGRDSAPVGPGQREAASMLWTVGADLLSGGIPAAGAVAQADLLRAVHRARAAGVHAAAAGAVRVVEQVRAARRDEPGFRLAELTADVREMLLACHRVTAGEASALGVARRDYEPVGDLRLHGIFSEPVRAATGHAGVVTYLADAAGTVWIVSDVKPADGRPSTRTSVDLGEVRLSHHDLARAGLLAVNAHASTARRLSHGRARQAVATAGNGWFAEPLDALWKAPVADQVDRWLTAEALPAQERPAAYDLAFLEGTVLGAGREGLLLEIDGDPAAGLVVTVRAAVASTAAPYLGNLRLLATHAAGQRIRLAGRFTGARQVTGLAFAAEWLPEVHGGHTDLGATTLTRADMPAAASTTADMPAAASTRADIPAAASTTAGMPAAASVTADVPAGTGAAGTCADTPGGPPLHLLRHQLERVVAAGRSVLLAGVDDDVRRLGAAHLGGAAAVLAGLGAAGVRRTRDVFGRLDPHDAQVLARAWLAAAVYERAAGREVMRAAWTRPPAGG